MTRFLLGACCLSAASCAWGQIPDTLFSLDPGGRSLGSGGAFNVTNSDTLSSFWNPAGLGYIRGRQVGLVYRSFSGTRSRLAGTYYAPLRTTSGGNASQGVSHLGFATPFWRGTLGVSYTVGGYVDDVATGVLPIDGTGSTVVGYREERYSKTDFLTLAYGTTLMADSLAIGAGLTYAQNYLRYSESGTPTGGFWQPISRTGNGSGVGVIAGLQFVPSQLPNASFAVSYRSPIGLSGNGSTAFMLDKIPARLMMGGAYRLDNMRGRADYLVLGMQYEQYSASGTNNYKFQRDSHTGMAFGAEYHYILGESGSVPIRLGYKSFGSGGNDFGSRNAITYGIGFQPGDRRYSIDLGWVSARGGRTDFALTATYRFR